MAEELRKRRAVVLEDEAMILIDIQQQLEQLGFDVSACLGDGEALAALDAPCDLLLINLGLGDTRRRRFTELARARGIALIIASGTRPAAVALGDAIFLAKPYSSQDLMDAVNRASPNARR